MAGLRNVLPFPSSGFWAQPTEVKFTESRGKPATCFPTSPPRRRPQISRWRRSLRAPPCSPRQSNGPQEPFWKLHPAQAAGAALLPPRPVRREPPPLPPSPGGGAAGGRAGAGDGAQADRATPPPVPGPRRRRRRSAVLPSRPPASGSAGPDGAAAWPPAPGPERGECAGRLGWGLDSRRAAQGTTDLQQGRARPLLGQKIQNPVLDKGLWGEWRGGRAGREVPVIPGSKLIVLWGPASQRVCRKGGVWGAAGQRGLPCPAQGPWRQISKSNTVQVPWGLALPLGTSRQVQGRALGEESQDPVPGWALSWLS